MFIIYMKFLEILNKNCSNISHHKLGQIDRPTDRFYIAPKLCLRGYYNIAADKVFFLFCFFQPKTPDIFLILHENIYCGYSLEAPL